VSPTPFQEATHMGWMATATERRAGSRDQPTIWRE
jgi:hypothetical protein